MAIIRSSRLYLCYCRVWCVMPWLLLVGGQVQGSWLCVRDEGSCRTAPDRLPPATNALHTTRGNNTCIVSKSWWWPYKCPKHVEQITIAINHSVATSWFSSLHIYNDARTNICQSLELLLTSISLLCNKLPKELKCLENKRYKNLHKLCDHLPNFRWII